MGDLEFYELPLGDITLERIDVCSEKHMKVVDTMRDNTAISMCYDIQNDINQEKNGVLQNNYLVKNSDGYFGYMHISTDIDGTRVLSSVIQEKFRGMGLGRIVLTSVSNYLLDSGIASDIKLYIRKSNVISSHVAISCGFERGTLISGGMFEYCKKRK